MTIENMAGMYLAVCERRTTNTLTNANRRRLLAPFVSWANGRNIDDDLLPEYKRSLAAEISQKTGKTLTVGTQAQRLREASALCRWLAGRGYISHEVNSSVSAIKQPRVHHRDALSVDDLQQIIGNIRGNSLQAERDRLAIQLCVVCAFRCCELSRLRIGDIHSYGAASALLVHGKGHLQADTLQPIPQQLVERLQRFAARLEHHRAGDPLLPSLDHAGNGRAITPAGWSRIIKQRMVDAGYTSDRLTAHSLRHSSVTIGMDAGASLLELQQHARHADISTTTIYTHEHDRLTSRVPGTIWDALCGLKRQVKE